MQHAVLSRRIISGSGHNYDCIITCRPSPNSAHSKREVNSDEIYNIVVLLKFCLREFRSFENMAYHTAYRVER